MQARRGFLQMRWRSPRIFMWGCRNSLASIRICNQGLCSSLANHMPANTCHPSVRTITCISSMMTLSISLHNISSADKQFLWPSNCISYGTFAFSWCLKGGDKLCRPLHSPNRGGARPIEKGIWVNTEAIAAAEGP